MSENLGRGKRTRRKTDYTVLDKDGFQEVSSKKQRKIKAKGKREKSITDNDNENTKNTENNETESENRDDNDNEAIPGTSSPNINSDIDMGRGSQSEGDEISDVPSEELERQNQELAELDRQIADEKSKRTSKQKKERKAKMAEMQRAAEEKRKILQRMREGSSESEHESPPKKRRTVAPVRKERKSKDGKGVKSSAKGKKLIPNRKDQNIRKTKNGPGRSDKRSKKKTPSSGSQDDYSSSENDSDEFDTAIKIAQQKSRRSVKSSISNKASKNFAGKRSKQDWESEESKDSSSDSSTSSDTMSSEDSSLSESEKRKHRRSRRKRSKKGRTIKSGVKAKAHKIRLKTSELCAQAMLDEEHYPGNFDLEHLTFDQLVAGELEICTMIDISRKERNARLKILKLLAYFAQLLPQNSLLEVYKAVILKVEKGQYSWSEELTVKVENMLDRAVSKNNAKRESEKKLERESNHKIGEKQDKKNKKEFGVALKNGEKIIYCAEYNKGKCDKENSHEGKFGGRDVFKHHICRNCLMTDKEKRSHSEQDENCPNKAR